LKKEKGHDYYPTRLEFDRYLFLEALISARKFFILSYIGKSPLDQALLPESSVVSELFSFLHPKNIIVHPDVPFDPHYFKNEKGLHNYSLKDFEAAESLYKPKKKTYFIPEFYHSSPPPAPSIPEGEHVIDVRDLKRLLRYPLSFFLEKALHIYF